MSSITAVQRVAPKVRSYLDGSWNYCTSLSKELLGEEFSFPIVVGCSQAENLGIKYELDKNNINENDMNSISF